IAARDDELARAPGDRVIAIGAAPTEISRLEPAIVTECLSRSVRPLPVSRKDVGAAHLDLADLVLRQVTAAPNVHHSSLLAGEWPTDRPWPPLTLIRIGQVHDRLGHTVALKNALPEHPLELREELWAERRRPRDKQAQGMWQHWLYGRLR